ncbi:MAG: trehalose-phosphatase [Nitrospirota bacterium]|nr:MAG: trehalose-phosphatase [Nitrospirota bacterium]
MKADTSFPTLDLAQVDAAFFNLDEVLLRSDRTLDPVFQELRQRTLASAATLARELQRCHIKTAIVTASTDGSEMLSAPSLSVAFDKQVTGVRKGFVQAAQLLKASPERTAIFDSTQAGVKAARAGQFKVIVVFNHSKSPEALQADGADVVLADLCELRIKMQNGLIKRNTITLPSGLEPRRDVFRQIHDKSVVVFLDYDGTLTPIVARPDLAILSEHTRETLRQLAKHCTVGVISGRDRVTVQQMVNVDSLIYAGSHGFDISGPKNMHMQHEIGTQFLPLLDQVEASLHEELDSILGTLIERKRFSVAVHYRLVGAQDLETIRSSVEAVLSQYPDIRPIHGKKLYDLQPGIDWDKGKALTWLLEALNIPRDRVMTFFFGDDVTDEDAFRVLQNEGIGMIVEDSSRYTYATYRLNNPEEVDQFLRHLTTSIRSPSL